ncbi:hypothetical protein NK6_3022 [Bradyrhizobium diazoefficiens]|uniref:Uncharacterized protein n=1 Tax=Bradyrhizobium diazoefficiens TaxID=1355477 RepID=A0A0E4BMV8_9BRAD|nr:hypothetical protein NK6_3022 [Bradyrhizobium diazoefficiens]
MPRFQQNCFKSCTFQACVQPLRQRPELCGILGDEAIRRRGFPALG